MNPMANGRSVRSRTSAACALTQSGPSVAWMPPNEPMPPPADTAAANVPPLCIAIGADMMGCWRPNSSVNRVWITFQMVDAAFTRLPERREPNLEAIDLVQLAKAAPPMCR